MNTIQISEITINDRLRQVNKDKVIELADSIKEIGLINAITLNQDNTLIAGNHRIEAYKLLGKDSIEYNTVNLEVLKAQLAEIDENIIRNELTVLDRAYHLSKRKDIYEELYPETKNGGDRKSENIRTALCRSDNTKSFTEDTAKKIGVSQSTIQRELQIDKKIIPEVKEQIRGTELENNKTALLTLARKEPEQQKQIIKRITSGEVETVKQAEKEIKKDERKKDIDEQIIQIENSKESELQGVFDVIVIDPPWDYGTKYDPNGRRVANPYPEMSIEQLQELDLPSADNSVMWLWTTQAYLFKAKELLEHWGFTYKNTLVWDKDKMGMGEYLRLQCEFCLLGIKGKPIFKSKGERDIIREGRREHSRKPDAFYEMVDKFCTGRKLDYFSRTKRDNWTVYGNDLEKF